MADVTGIPAAPPIADQKVIVGAEKPGAPVNVGVPTQVANPRRASWRTFVQSIIGFLVSLNVILPIVAAFLASNSETAAKILGQYYGPTIAWINGAIIVGAFLAKLLAQIMAIPAVNAWITKYLPALSPIRQEITS